MSYATYSVPCPYCNVATGDLCRTSTGRVAEPHKARIKSAITVADTNAARVATARPVYPSSLYADAADAVEADQPVEAEEDTKVTAGSVDEGDRVVITRVVEDTVAPGDQVDTVVEDDDRCSTCEQAAIVGEAYCLTCSSTFGRHDRVDITTYPATDYESPATKARRAHAAADRGPRTLDPDAIVLDTVQHHDGRVSLATFEYLDGMTIESRVVNGRVMDARLYDRDDRLRVTFYRASDYDALNDVLNDAGVYEDDAPSIGFGGPVHRRAPRATNPNDVVQAIEAINALNDTLIDPTVTGKYAPAGLHDRYAVDAAFDALVEDIEEASVVEDDVNPTTSPYGQGKTWAVRTVQEYNADFGPKRAIMLTALAVKFAEDDREDDDTGYEHGKVEGFGLALNVLDGYIG